MNLHHLYLPAMIAPQFQFPGSEQTVLIFLRWIHFVSGIIWVGLLYFLVLVNADFLQKLDQRQRRIVVPKLMPKALWWFRWSSVVAVLAGLAYWGHIVGADASAASASGEPASVGHVVGTFFLIWTLAFAVEMGMLMSPAEVLRKGAVLGVILVIVILAAAYFFLSLNEQGWESNRTLCIGLGGGLGWFMMLNVWGIDWRMQKKIIRFTEDNATKGTPMPEQTAKMAQLSSLCSRVNFWLSFPMLFFMGAASHYAIFPAR
jgi:uncharacterized membrane protein